MPIRRGGADAGHARGIGKGKSGRALLRDQIERRLQQRLFQIAVVIAALGAGLILVLAPAHVKAIYMKLARSHYLLDARGERANGSEPVNRRRGSAEPA